jgi:hypothetical protein
VRVPADAGKGKAKVTVSFPDWTEGKVVPANFEVPILDEPPARQAPAREAAEEVAAPKHQPDRLPLGRVCVGATVEASFMLMCKGDDPKKVPLTVEAPRFVKVLDKSVVSRDIRDGRNSVKGVAGIVVIEIDTSKPGSFEGEIKVTLGTTSESVPVSVVVKPAAPAAVKILVVASPFDCYSTDDAGLFKDWTDLVGQSQWNVNYLIVAQGKPVFRDLDLSKFDVILLDPDGLIKATPEDVKRARAFAERGGRLVVAANHFFSGSVVAANKVLDGFGLKMLDKEAELREQKEANLNTTAFAPEVVKAGIRSLRFYRASPIEVTAGKPARVLVRSAGTGGPADGFVAAAKVGKGEVMALGESLWWGWINATRGKQSDNGRLLQLLLTPAAGKETEQKD